MSRQPIAIPLDAASGEEIDPFCYTRKNIEAGSIPYRTLDVVKSSLHISMEQPALQPNDSPMYSIIEEKKDSTYELILETPAKVEDGQREPIPSDQEKITVLRPKKASNASQGTPIDQISLNSESIMKVGCYDKPQPVVNGGLYYEELECNFALRKSNCDNDYLPVVDEILEKGRVVPDSEASASKGALFDKMEAGLKNRKLMAGPLQAAPSDVGGYETPVENVITETLNKGCLILDPEASTSNSALCDKMEVGPKNRKPLAGPVQAAPCDVGGYERPKENLKNEILNKGCLIPGPEAPTSNSVLRSKMEVGPKNRKPLSGPVQAAPCDVGGYERPMENLKKEILNTGRLIPDSEAATSNSVLCSKMEVGPKNRKPMAGPLLAAPNDGAGYETLVENLNKGILNKGRLTPDSKAFTLSNALCDKLEVGPKNRKPMAEPIHRPQATMEFKTRRRKISKKT